MIREGWYIFKESLDAYIGTGMFMTLFLGSIGCILINETKTDGKALCGYSIITIIVTMNPVSAYIISNYLIGRDVYWRMFWLLPVAPIIAYTGTKVISQVKENSKRYMISILSILIIILSGSFMLTKDNFSQSTNWYKVPEEVIRVCDIIAEDSDNPKIIVPEGLIAYIRQYNANIKMLYGRQMGKDNLTSDPAYPIYESMNSVTPNIELLAMGAREGKCNYIVLYSGAQGIERLEEYGFELLGIAGGYHIYEDVNMEGFS